MKIKEGYILDTIDGKKVAISLDASKDKFSGMIVLKNEVAVFLWEHLQKDTEEECLVKALTENYVVEETKARTDVKAFVKKLEDAGILEK